MFVTLLHALGLSSKNPPSRRRPAQRWVKPKLEILEHRNLLSSYTVTTTADDPNIHIPDETTLRDAINEAKESPDASSTIGFLSTVQGQIQLQTELPDLNKNITISGPGASVLEITGSGNVPNPFRVFQVDAGATCEFDNLGIAGGYVNGDGGGILNQGTLTLQNDQIFNNQAIGNFGDGGGIYNAPGANLTLITTSLSDNQAGEGGGIFNQGVLGLCCDSIIYSNGARLGGGLFNLAGTTTIHDDSQINANMAMEDGGGVYISSGTVSMSAGTVYNNQAENRGGGIFVYQGSLTLAGGVTIQQNSAATSGGGLYLATPSTTTFNGCTISGNQAPTGVGYYKQNGATINPLKIDNQDGFNEGP